MATYLELVNNALTEAGVDLDPLTSSNFAVPPEQSMYTKFKKWVKDSYKELQIACDTWEFKSARASVYIYPAIYIENGNRATAPPVASTYNSDDTDVTYTVQQVITHSGAWASGTAKATLYLREVEGEFKFNEYFDEVTPTPAGNVFLSKDRGHYNFLADGQVTDLQNIDYTTLQIQTVGGSTIQTNDNSTELREVCFVPWSIWLDSYYDTTNFGFPQYFTEAPDGSLDFYPKPDKQYVLHFTYQTTSNTLALHSDTPTNIPSDYQDIIYWDAVTRYATYDKQSAVFARAKKQYDFYYKRLIKNQSPVPTFGISKFNG